MPTPVITAVMQEKINADKIQTRIDNEMYLRKHPEIRDILDYFMKEVLVSQPANVQEFASALFGDENLRAKVEKHKSENMEYERKFEPKSGYRV
ncbi:RIIa domain-containing protein 1 [Borealophlyctis nickersoniae]|nr:RIIa domain-containing protein 1 [Borealophlyctis nickersoniae]